MFLDLRLLLLSWFLLRTCYAGGSSKQESWEIDISFLSPTLRSLGSEAAFGEELKSAFKVAVAVINSESLASNKPLLLSARFDNLTFREGDLDDFDNLARIVDLSTSVALIGGLDSWTTAMLHQSLSRQGSKLPQVTYGSTATWLSEQSSFPRLFRTCSTDRRQAQAIVDVVDSYRWKVVSMLYQSDLSSRTLADQLLSQLRSRQIGVAHSCLLSNSSDKLEITTCLKMIKASGARIMLFLARGEAVINVLTSASHQGMLGAGWAWVGGDGLASYPFSSSDLAANLSAGILAICPKAFHGLQRLNFAMTWLSQSAETHPGVIWNSDNEPEFSPYTAQVYDAVVLVYQALDSLVSAGRLTKGTSKLIARDLVTMEIMKYKHTRQRLSSARGKDGFYFDEEDKGFSGPPLFDVVNFQVFPKGTNWIGRSIVIGFWDGTRAPGMALSRLNRVIWPGRVLEIPTDQGTPSRPTFSIGILCPLGMAFGWASAFCPEYLTASRLLVEQFSAESSVDFTIDLKTTEEGNGSDCGAMLGGLLRDSVVAVIVGPFSRSCLHASSHAIAANKIPVISFTPDRPGDPRLDPFTFWTSAAEHDYLLALASILRRYGVKQVVPVLSWESVPEDTTKWLQHLLEGNACRVLESIYISSDTTESLSFILGKIRKSHVRCVYLCVQPEVAERFLALAQTLGMYSAGWLWIGCPSLAVLFQKAQLVPPGLTGLLALAPSTGEDQGFLQFKGRLASQDPSIYPGLGPGKITMPALPPFIAQLYAAFLVTTSAIANLVAVRAVSFQSSVNFTRTALYHRLKELSKFPIGRDRFQQSSGPHSLFFNPQHSSPANIDVLGLELSGWSPVGRFSSIDNSLFLTQEPKLPGGGRKFVAATRPSFRVVGLFPTLLGHGGILSSMGKIWKVAMEVAVDFVNSNQSNKATLSATLVDSFIVLNSTLLVAVTESALAVIGAGDSFSTWSLGQTDLSLGGITVLSYAATLLELSTSPKFHQFAHMPASDQFQAEALVSLVLRFNWKRLNLVCTNCSYALSLCSSLQSSLESYNVRANNINLHNQNGTLDVSDLEPCITSSTNSVQVVVAGPNDAQTIFQEAARKGLIGKGWVWIGSDGVLSAVPHMPPALRVSMQGLLGFLPPTGKGPVFNALMEHWANKFPLSYHELRSKGQVPYTVQVLDTVLVLSFALNWILEEGCSPENITSKLLYERLKAINDLEPGFVGAGGAFYFTSKMNGPPLYDLMNINVDQLIPIGRYDPNRGLDLISEVRWPGGTLTVSGDTSPKRIIEKIPSQSSSHQQQPVRMNHVLILLVTVIVVLGLVLLALLTFIRIKFSILFPNQKSSNVIDQRFEEVGGGASTWFGSACVWVQRGFFQGYQPNGLFASLYGTQRPRSANFPPDEEHSLKTEARSSFQT